jgi:hypothetical protein
MQINYMRYIEVTYSLKIKDDVNILLGTSNSRCLYFWVSGHPLVYRSPLPKPEPSEATLGSRDSIPL